MIDSKKASKHWDKQRSLEPNNLVLETFLEQLQITGTTHGPIPGIQVCRTSYEPQMVVCEMPDGDERHVWTSTAMAIALKTRLFLLKYEAHDLDNEHPVEVAYCSTPAFGKAYKFFTAGWDRVFSIRHLTNRFHGYHKRGCQGWTIKERHAELGGDLKTFFAQPFYRKLGKTDQTMDVSVDNHVRNNSMKDNIQLDVDGAQFCSGCGAVEVVMEATSGQEKHTGFIREIARRSGAVALLVRHYRLDFEHIGDINIMGWLPTGIRYMNKRQSFTHWEHLEAELRTAHEMHLIEHPECVTENISTLNVAA